MKRKMLCLLLTLCMILGTAPMTPAFGGLEGTSDFVFEEVPEAAAELAAYESRPSVYWGANHFNWYSNKDKYDYLYFGWLGNESTGHKIKWRVLNYFTNSGDYDGIYLLAEHLYGETIFAKSESLRDTEWANTQAKIWCDNFMKDAFSSNEQNAIFPTNITDGSPGGYYETLKNAKVFFPSVNELTDTRYGFQEAPEWKDLNRYAYHYDEPEGSGSVYWTRSADSSRLTYVYSSSYDPAEIGKIEYGSTGHYLEGTFNLGDLAYGARPAMNLTKANLTLIKAADNSWQQDFGYVPSFTGNRENCFEWKAAVADENSFRTGADIGQPAVQIASLDRTAVGSGGVLNLSHAATNTYNAYYTNVTAALLNEHDSLVCYGSINTDRSATSSVITLPEDLPVGTYTLHVFGEIWKGENLSDYISGEPFTAQIQVVDGIDISKQNFPDDNFRANVKTFFDKDDNDILDPSELEAATQFNYSGINAGSSQKIKDITGIEHLYNLKYVDFQYHDLKTADFSKNSNLFRVTLTENPSLSSVDVSGCPKLARLTVDGCALTALDVSKNSNLVLLNCSRNQIKSLDLRPNTALTDLVCNENLLEELDVSACTELTSLICHTNHLTALNLETNTKLTNLNCTGNTTSVTAAHDRTYNLHFLGDANRMTVTAGGVKNDETGVVTLDPGATSLTYIYDTKSSKGNMTVTVAVAVSGDEAPVALTHVYPDIPVPVKGEAPVTAVPVGAGHLGGAISWDPAENPFKGGTTYKGTFTLTAGNGYYFDTNTKVHVGGKQATRVSLGENGSTGTYSLTFNRTAAASIEVSSNLAEAGTVVSSASSANRGSKITLTVTPNEGWHFKGWQVEAGGVTPSALSLEKTSTFTMGGDDVSIKAIFETDVDTNISLDGTYVTWYSDPAFGDESKITTLNGIIDVPSILYFRMNAGYYYSEPPVMTDLESSALEQEGYYKVVYTPRAGDTELVLPTPQELAHNHPVCGEVCTHNGEHESVSWKATRTLPEEPGYYYLENDVTVDMTWWPEDGIYLCLNGHSLARNDMNGVIYLRSNLELTITDCSDKVRFGNFDGTWWVPSDTSGNGDLVGGLITVIHNGGISTSSEYYGGVFVNGGATFNLYAGNIVNNRGYHAGAGVRVGSDLPGTFNMYGGSIVGNQSNYDGSGVYVAKGTFNMYGGKIAHNGLFAYKIGGVVLADNPSTVMNLWSGAEVSDNRAADISLSYKQPLQVKGTLTNETPIILHASREPYSDGKVVVAGSNDTAKFAMEKDFYTLASEGENLVLMGTGNYSPDDAGSIAFEDKDTLKIRDCRPSMIFVAVYDGSGKMVNGIQMKLDGRAWVEWREDIPWTKAPEVGQTLKAFVLQPGESLPLRPAAVYTIN